jgi:hypothetical protein
MGSDGVNEHWGKVLILIFLLPWAQLSGFSKFSIVLFNPKVEIVVNKLCLTD